jgi:hypothetical protein
MCRFPRYVSEYGSEGVKYVLMVEERKGFLVGYKVYIKFRFVVVGLFAVDRVVGDGGNFLCV